MKTKDKAVVAFLVSMGIFSTVQAMQYVRTLSVGEKNKIAVTVKNSSHRIVICSGVDTFNSGADEKTKAG